MDDNVKLIDYFRANIFEAESSYNAWKMIYYARCTPIVGQKLAVQYTKIQNYHNPFFTIAERSLLIAWVLLSCHAFDKDNRSCSLSKVDPELCSKFLEDAENNNIMEQLKTTRDKLFAHKESGIDPKSITLPSVERMDAFFTRLKILYNELSKLVDRSFTAFDFTDDVKQSMEHLYMNLERGETMRLKEIDIEWMWKKDDSRALKKV